MYLGVFSSIVDGSPVFARDTVLKVEVFLYSSLQFAHCSVDMRRPVFCSLSMETCSEPVCLPRLLLALGISPLGGVHNHSAQKVKVELQTEGLIGSSGTSLD